MSELGNSSLINNREDGSDDVWTLEECVFYRWKDGKLVRAKDSLFIYSEFIVLELKDYPLPVGWLNFFMDARLCYLENETNSPCYYNGPELHYFVERLRRAKPDPLFHPPVKSILSVPRTSHRAIKSGKWILSSVEAGKILATYWKDTHQIKLIIKEDGARFTFESNGHEQEYTAEFKMNSFLATF